MADDKNLLEKLKKLADDRNKTRDQADATLTTGVNDLKGTATPCEDACMDAWLECMLQGRPEAECDAEFLNCVNNC